MKSILMSVSGGLDSTVLALHADSNHNKVVGIPFHYGNPNFQWQGHVIEKLTSDYKMYDSVRTSISLDNLCKPFHNSLEEAAQLFRDRKDKTCGYYDYTFKEEETLSIRNLFIATMAIIAEKEGFDEIWISDNKGSRHYYPKQDQRFVSCLNSAVSLITNGKTSLEAPFLFMEKHKIVALGKSLGCPFQNTRTCTKNQRIACGKCKACQNRLKAFAVNDLVDPIEYISREITPFQDVE